MELNFIVNMPNDAPSDERRALVVSPAAAISDPQQRPKQHSDRMVGRTT